MKKVPCRSCNGSGKVFGIFPVYSEEVPVSERKPFVEFECSNCLGSLWECQEWKEKGEILKNKRIERKMTLRKASKMLNINVLTLSKMERGVIEPDSNISYDFHMKLYNK